MKMKVENTKSQAFEIVKQILQFAPTWDSMKIVVKLGKQKDNTYVAVK